MILEPNLKNLTEIRKTQGITKTEMAKRLGLSLNGYGLKEKGESPLTLQEARKIAKMFGLTIDALFYSVVCRVI
jgi:DNA-binding XRE family transcriptional regulator